MDETYSIVLNGVIKEYRRDEFRIPVLVDLDLTVAEGEFLALMGPSGSGKTTLLNLIAGLDRATRGSVIVHGQDLGAMSEARLTRWRADHVGFIFQLYNLIPVLTAFENVELPLLLTHLSRRRRREHVQTALRIVGLEGREDHYPRQLSGGQEQRVAIARAIVTDPYLLVADEPTGDLDRTSAGEILDLLEQLNREFRKTIVMVTHDPLAARRAGRILQLDKGRLVDDVLTSTPDRGRVMKFLHYILRNVRRNPVRSLLTVASTAITLFLMVSMASFASVNAEVSRSMRTYNRLVVMNAQGFAGMVPIARVREIAALPGVVAASPFCWFGGKYGEEVMPFAQFGVDPQVIFTIYDELTVPPDPLRAFQDDKAGCVIGDKLAEERGLKIGDPFPLKADLYPFDLTLTIRGIYDGPANRDRRICMFHWDYLDEGLKRTSARGRSGNAGVIMVKCKDASVMAGLSRKIDQEYRNTDTPTRTQTEEAFLKGFGEMMRDFQKLISAIGLAVVVSLVLVAGNAMAMALRERTTEVAILKAIGYGKGLILFLVLAEAIVVAGLGGLLGSFGCKLLCDVVDLAKYSAGTVPVFYIPWTTALGGLAVSLLIGFASGIIPALMAARLSVVQGLREVV